MSERMPILAFIVAIGVSYDFFKNKCVLTPTHMHVCGDHATLPFIGVLAIFFIPIIAYLVGKRRK